MGDYILRSDAVQCANDLSVDMLNDGLDSASYGAQAVAEWLKDLPSADVVEVVRCKDCRHRDPEDRKCDSGEMERQGCVFPVDDDYFCAYGER